MARLFFRDIDDKSWNDTEFVLWTFRDRNIPGQEHHVNIMAVDLLVASVAKQSTAMALSI